MPTLLLADDSITTQRVIALTFADQAIRVVSVDDGQQAIDQMMGLRPDIVLASTSLPRTGGYELCQYMLGVEALKTVPVLLLSGAFESVDGARLKASGARGVIEKPLEPTAVINRVRELLGLKEAQPVPPAGRLITSAATTADKKVPVDAKPPVGQRAAVPVLKDDHQALGLDSVARPSLAGISGHGRDHDRAALDTALDSLDQHLAGRLPGAAAVHPVSTPPPGRASSGPDLRSPVGPPAATGDAGVPNAVFEVDSEWFAADPREHDRASRHEILADANEAMPPREAPAGVPVFEADDQWFAEGETAGRSRAAQARDLALEMGIHDIDLPPAEPVPVAAAPPGGLDFDFGLDDLLRPPAPVAPAAVPAAAAPEHEAPAHRLETPEPVVPAHVTPAHAAPQLAPPQEVEAPQAPLTPSSVADDFAALLALETGDAPPPAAAVPALVPTVVPAVVPEITDAMLDQLAQRVADRMSAGTFGADLREAITATLRESVRSIVSETAERLVRDEIARVKARAERDIR